jgi:hypothetical protein
VAFAAGSFSHHQCFLGVGAGVGLAATGAAW